MEALRKTGLTIAEERERRDISGEELGRVIGVSEIKMREIERGRAICTYPQLEKIAEYLNIDVVMLVKGDAEYYEKNVVSCMNPFKEPENREKVLDLIYDYMDILDEVSE